MIIIEVLEGEYEGEYRLDNFLETYDEGMASENISKWREALEEIKEGRATQLYATNSYGGFDQFTVRKVEGK